jgi:hypothetical protein
VGTTYNMSIRQAAPTSEEHPLRVQIEAMREMAAREAQVAEISAAAADDQNPTLNFADLNPTEQSAASLGVNPNELKPIEWINRQHYNTLLKNNVLDAKLAQGLEAYQAVAKGC